VRVRSPPRCWPAAGPSAVEFSQPPYFGVNVATWARLHSSQTSASPDSACPTRCPTAPSPFPGRRRSRSTRQPCARCCSTSRDGPTCSPGWIPSCGHGRPPASRWLRGGHGGVLHRATRRRPRNRDGVAPPAAVVRRRGGLEGVLGRLVGRPRRRLTPESRSGGGIDPQSPPRSAITMSPPAGPPLLWGAWTAPGWGAMRAAVPRDGAPTGASSGGVRPSDGTPQAGCAEPGGQGPF